MEDETTVSDRKQLIHVSNPQRCPGDEFDSDWWIHWSFKKWSIRSLMWCDVFTSALQEPPGEEADSGERQHHLQRRGGQRRRSLTPVSRLRPLTHPSPPGSDPLRGRAEPQEAEGVGRRLGGRGGQRQPHPSSETPQRGAGLWDRAGVQTTPTAGPRPGLQPDQVRPESRVQLLHWFKQRRSRQFLPVISHQNVFFSAGSWRRQPTPPWTICPSTSLCASLWRKDRPMERLRTEEERREEEKLREEQEVEKDLVWTASVRNSTPSTSWREEDSSLWVWKPSRVNRYNVFEPGCCDQLHH